MQITSLRVGRALARLDLTRRYDRARSEDDVYLYQLSAAHRHEVYEPFDADAVELNAWLVSVRADRALCRAAWDSFMEEDAAQTQDTSSKTANR